MSYSKMSFKYFIGHKNVENIRPLCIMIPKMNRYLKCFGESKYIMSFVIEDEKLFKAYNKVWDKNINITPKGFGSEPMYN